MMEQRAGHDEIVRISFDCTLENVELPDFQTRRLQVLDVSNVKIASNYVASRHHAVGQHSRNGAVAAAELEAPPARARAKLCDVGEFGGIQQRRHERHPLPFAGHVMRQNVFSHLPGFSWRQRKCAPRLHYSRKNPAR
jgi:hypothetical protein